MIVEVHDLCKSYPSFHLQHVSFGLERGRITGFIGRNGAGKTTTIKAMLNLIEADSGDVSYFDLPLKGNESTIKKRIGYSTGTLSWYPRKKIKTYRKYMNLFSIDESKTPLELSEGMKVKVNLMLALSHQAEVLILDEPTSGLDPFSRNELLNVFTELKKEGIAVFFSTHIISDIEKCADDIVYISNGKIIAATSKADFIDRYSEEGESLEDTMLRMEGGAFHA